jgi:hypothetical protein
LGLVLTLSSVFSEVTNVENDIGVDAKQEDDDAELSSLCNSVLRDEIDWALKR